MKVLRRAVGVGRGVAVLGAVVLMMPPVASGASGTSWTAQTVVSPRSDAQLGGIYMTNVTESCSSAGNCAAFGDTTTLIPSQQVLAVENQGTWSPVPALTNSVPGVLSYTMENLTCVADGDCLVVAKVTSQAFHTTPPLYIVASETDGVWGSFQGLAGSESLYDLGVRALTCSAPGDCVFSFSESASSTTPVLKSLVFEEVNGTWDSGTLISGTDSLYQLTGTSPNLITQGIHDLSCSSPGTCVAVGTYVTAAGEQDLFGLREVAGAWGSATSLTAPVPSDTYGSSVTLGNLSCATNDACVVSGTYDNGTKVFVSTESNGSWSLPANVGSLSTLGANAIAPTVLWCSSTSSCVLGGSYSTAAKTTGIFVVTSTGGTFASPTVVPSFATLDTKPTLSAGLTQLFCASVAACVAVGSYRSAQDVWGVFALSESSSVWSSVVNLKGASDTTTGQYFPAVLACTAASDCRVEGSVGQFGASQFVAREVNGTWAKLSYVHVPTLFNLPSVATILGLTCPSEGNCTAFGELSASGMSGPFVVDEKSGVWGGYQFLRGLTLKVGASLAVSLGSTLTSLSCASAGNCVAVGTTRTPSSSQPFIATESGGVWGAAGAIPGASALGSFVAASDVSCGGVGNCVAIGRVVKPSVAAGTLFEATEHSGVWSTATKLPGVALLSSSISSNSVDHVICTAPLNCEVFGIVATVHGTRMFTSIRAAGVWNSAALVPGETVTNDVANYHDANVACASLGTCTIAGTVTSKSTGTRVVLAHESAGKWVALTLLAGVSTSAAAVESVRGLACPSAHACTLIVDNRVGTSSSYRATEVAGVWPSATRVAWTGSAGTGLSLSSVACSSAGNCVIAENQSHQSGVITQTNGSWSTSPTTIPFVNAQSSPWYNDLDAAACVSGGSCVVGGGYSTDGEDVVPVVSHN